MIKRAGMMMHQLYERLSDAVSWPRGHPDFPVSMSSLFSNELSLLCCLATCCHDASAHSFEIESARSFSWQRGTHSKHVDNAAKGQKQPRQRLMLRAISWRRPRSRLAASTAFQQTVIIVMVLVELVLKWLWTPIPAMPAKQKMAFVASDHWLLTSTVSGRLLFGNWFERQLVLSFCCVWRQSNMTFHFYCDQPFFMFILVYLCTLVYVSMYIHYIYNICKCELRNYVWNWI